MITMDVASIVKDKKMLLLIGVGVIAVVYMMKNMRSVM